MVNGRVVNIASYVVSENDVIEIRQKSKSIAAILAAVQSTERSVPFYVEADHSALKGTFVSIPKLEDVPYPVAIEPNIIIEFYSR
jgi:small subunit ribosomal protein S4